jgi:thiamine kinase-like enzyme
MDNYLDIINEHFSSIELGRDKEPKNKFFISTTEDAFGSSLPVGFFYKFKILLKLFTYNFLEFFKHKIKSRVPLYKYLSIKKVFFDGTLHVNFHNGTVVLLEGNNKVVKYFFKDKEYFEMLYDTISPFLRYKNYFFDTFFVVEQTKHLKLNNSLEFGFLATKLKSKLDSYHKFLQLNTSDKDIFMIEYKILQIMEFYNCDRNLIFEYTDLSKELFKKVEKLNLVFCHGDLWSENIFQSESEEIQLIDYDKSIYYCEFYDLVYLHLMNHNVKLLKLSENFDNYSKEVFEFFMKSNLSIFKNFSLTNVKFSIYLFLLLKLTEQDFRNKNIGGSIGLLKFILNKL